MVDRTNSWSSYIDIGPSSYLGLNYPSGAVPASLIDLSSSASTRTRSDVLSLNLTLASFASNFRCTSLSKQALYGSNGT
jgi:hypothetical protein